MYNYYRFDKKAKKEISDKLHSLTNVNGIIDPLDQYVLDIDYVTFLSSSKMLIDNSSDIILSDLKRCSECHAISAIEYLLNPKYKIYTGYSLSSFDCSATWFNHSFIKTDNGILEPTPIKRDFYTGFELTGVYLLTFIINSIEPAERVYNQFYKKNNSKDFNKLVNEFLKNYQLNRSFKMQLKPFEYVYKNDTITSRFELNNKEKITLRNRAKLLSSFNI